jgi:hypothetical protein
MPQTPEWTPRGSHSVKNGLTSPLAPRASPLFNRSGHSSRQV